MNPSNLKKTWVLVEAELSVPECYFYQYVEIDMPYNDFIAFSEHQRKFVVEAEMSKLGYVLKNRNNIALDVYDFEYSYTNLSESVEIINKIVDWCKQNFQGITTGYYGRYNPWYIRKQLVEAVNRWKTHDIQEACKNALRDSTKDQVKHIQEISIKLNAMLNENNDCTTKEKLESDKELQEISMKLDAMLNENNNRTTKEQLESEKELIDKVLARINEKLPIISM